MLREPAERTASHYRMLGKLASRGERWAKLYVEGRESNSTPDGRLLAEADAFDACLRERTAVRPSVAAFAKTRINRVDTASVAFESSGATGVDDGMSPHTYARRFPPRSWHDCVAVACGFHACVVGQSIYEPQLRLWLNAFSAPQVLVLTLDEFAAAPSAALGRVAAFLGLGRFPRLVLNWKWAWNVGADKRRRAQSIAQDTLSQLRNFFAPYTSALGVLLRRRGQVRAAVAVDSWPRR